MDPQILTVDLGARFLIDDVVLYWEAAYAREFYLKIADGAGAWTDVRHETNGTGGMATIPVGATASKVMMAGIQRATSYGYSLYELQVHGSPATGVAPGRGGLPREYSLSEAFPNPFNPATVIRYQLPVASEVNLSVYDLLGRAVAVLVNERKDPGRYEVKFDATGLASGVYLYRLTAGGFGKTRKLLLMR
jgi:hypothetical protein